MRLAKVNAGHWKDGGSGPGFEKRYSFAEDCVDAGKTAISFLHTAGHPFHAGLDTEDVLQMTHDDLVESYIEEGLSENEAGNTASQIIRFRDWPVGTPLFFYLGRNTVYGIGYLKGEYEFDWGGEFHGADSDYNHPHVREVEWIEGPELFNRKDLPATFQGWLSNPQTVLDYDVEPGSNAAEYLGLAYGIGQALSGVSESERRILK